MNSKEIKKGQSDSIEVVNGDSLIVRERKVKLDMTKYIEEHVFTFDKAYDETVKNETVFQNSVSDLIEFAFQGGKVSVFAYGQTGSGKTYTMIGSQKTPGIYVLAANQLF